MPISKKLYDILSSISRFVLPAVGGLYYTLADIWGLPYGAQISATCAALIVAINVLLGVDYKAYENTLESK